MAYALCGFIWGMFIPYLARRFAKFMPATAAYALYDVFHFRFSLAACKRERYCRLLRKLRQRSLMYALFSAGVFYALTFRADNGIGWTVCFAGASLLLAEIDYRLQILPDIITFPLLILGFGAACFDYGLLPAESFIGAAAGYVLPTVAALPLMRKNKEAFGGGDVKYLSVVGAWLGMEKMIYVLLAACVLFAVYAIVRRKRFGAFGPALVLSALGALFW